MKVKRSEFSFRSSNGINTIRGIKICPEDTPVKAVVQISHGMVEHYDRYLDFMEYLASEGIAVYMHDHLGHKHSVDSDEQLGFFAHNNGYKHVLNDLLYTAQMAKGEYPDVKFFMLGHSMGSFYARVFAATFPQVLDGVLISGTGGPNKAASMGLVAVNAMIKIKGEKHRSETVNKMVFGEYLKKIENPKTPSDWITRDEETVLRYSRDKYCQFIFTLAGFRDLMNILSQANRPQTYKKTSENLPVYIFSGSMDPVGDYGKGVIKVVEGYKSAGCKDVTLKLYDGGRHEMLNEINRKEVYSDILNWIIKRTEV